MDIEVSSSPSVSVCMATYNGDKFIEEQIESILSQLGPSDELVISDDGSDDTTLQILETVARRDSRVKVLKGPKNGLIKNFENALKHARGELIFLSDQDDVWLPGRVDAAIKKHKTHATVVVNACVIDQDSNMLAPQVYYENTFKYKPFKTLIVNRYIGCTMSFRADVLKRCLPFPDNIPMHDWWIGLTSELYFETAMIAESFVKYRRHGENVTQTLGKSTNTFLTKVKYRINLLIAVVTSRLGAKRES